MDYFLHLARTNGTNFINNNDNVNAIKADFIKFIRAFKSFFT